MLYDYGNFREEKNKRQILLLNIKSVQEEELFAIYVFSFIIW